MATTMRLIGKTTLGSSAATITLSSIPATYSDLLIVGSIRSTRTGFAYDDLLLQFNSDTAANYSWRSLRGSGSAASSANSTGTSILLGVTTAANATASTFASFEVYIPNYAGSTNKSTSSVCAQETNGSEAYIFAMAGLWSSTAAITSVTLDLQNGDMTADSSVFVYGITKS